MLNLKSIFFNKNCYKFFFFFFKDISLLAGFKFLTDNRIMFTYYYKNFKPGFNNYIIFTKKYYFFINHRCMSFFLSKYGGSLIVLKSDNIHFNILKHNLKNYGLILSILIN